MHPQEPVFLGPAQQVTLIVGLNRGKTAGLPAHCSLQPLMYEREYVDEVFVRLRALQVGIPHVEASRVDARGWYQGMPEGSILYEVLYLPGSVESETSWEQFLDHMGHLAEQLRFHLCQDSVLLIADDGQHRQTYLVEARANIPPVR